MPWFKVDDAFYRHRKVRKLGKDKLPAVGLWQLAGTWSADNLTDGFVPCEQVKGWDPKLRYANRLVEVGFWTAIEHDGEEGFEFHEWSTYQPMRDEVEKRRIEDWMRKDLYARPGLVQAVKDRDGDLCRYCGLAVRWSDRRGPRGGTIDHVQPVSRNGKNELNNLVIACRSCNSRKQDRTPDEAGMPLLTPPPANPVTSSGPKSELDGNQNGTGKRQSPEPVPEPVPVVEDLGGEGHLPARASAPPPPRCPKHATAESPGPCGRCADARRTRQTWDTEQADIERAARLAASRCRLCDADGRRWDPTSKARGTVGPCDHKPIPRQEPA
jgi:5-methylcytosine-specific restriction endonuclease McrA